jgi:hypothetical protein
VSAWLWWICLALLVGNASAGLAGSLADELLKPGKAADPAQVPTLRVLDDAGQLRWQVPVVLWAAPREELGGYLYPCGVPLDKPLDLRAPLVFVGYGMTTKDRDDYGGQRIEGSIAVIFTGPRAESGTGAVQESADEFRAAVQHKVENAKAHGALAVLLERDPLQGPCTEQFEDHPSQITELPPASPTLRFSSVGELVLPTFSIGSWTLETIVALSSDLFKAPNTTGNATLRYLVQDAASRGKGVGPVPLALQAEVSWTSGQLRKAAGRRCDIWYQSSAALGQDLSKSAETCDRAIEQLEGLLATHLDGRISVLLFPDWRSKLFCTGTLGWGAGSEWTVALVYQGDGAKAEPFLIHELCHVVAYRQGNPPPAFDEGLAELVGDVLGDLAAVTAGPVDADRVTAENLAQGQLWSVKELLAIPPSRWGTWEGRSPVSYPEAASFCAYAIRKIGFSGFRDLYRTLKRNDLDYNLRAIERALGKDIGTIEGDWHAYLRGISR